MHSTNRVLFFNFFSSSSVDAQCIFALLESMPTSLNSNVASCTSSDLYLIRPCLMQLNCMPRSLIFNVINMKTELYFAVNGWCRIKELGLAEEQYEWYLDLRRHGTVQHSGFSFVFDLMVLFTTGLTDVRDVIPFPRSYGKVAN